MKDFFMLVAVGLPAVKLNLVAQGHDVVWLQLGV